MEELLAKGEEASHNESESEREDDLKQGIDYNGYNAELTGGKGPMDRGAWWVTVHGAAMSQTQLSTHTHSLYVNL